MNERLEAMYYVAEQRKRERLPPSSYLDPPLSNDKISYYATHTLYPHQRPRVCKHIPDPGPDATLTSQ